jgi:hypothetical protein
MLKWPLKLAVMFSVVNPNPVRSELLARSGSGYGSGKNHYPDPGSSGILNEFEIKTTLEKN